MVGNFLEVRETIDCLQGRGPGDLRELTLRLTAHMLVMGGIRPDLSTAEELCRQRLADGSAWSRFLKNAELQGGRTDVLLDPVKGPRAPVISPLRAAASGFLQRLDAYRIGLASGLLGASRARKEDAVLPDAGIELLRSVGEEVRAGEEICLLHAPERRRLEEALEQLKDAVVIGGEPPPPRRLVLEEIAGDALAEN
jgi:pyrimidine-nucleoside phosphorylase